MRKGARLITFVGGWCAILMLLATPSVHARGSLIITEIMGSNTRIHDETGDSPDWIEIHNSSAEPIDLAGYHLSDKSDKRGRWTFPGTVIQPGEYMLVFASGKDRKDAERPLHTNFKLSEKDDGVYLSDADCTPLDHITIEKLPKDISYGRHPDTGEAVYFPAATPREANTLAAFSPVVTYSVQGGMYTSPVRVALSTAGGDAVIYYTTDGSTPTTASSVYTGPITIDRNATIRAIALQKGRLISPPTGQTYFIDFDNKGIGILSIAIESEKLWDEKKGLFREIAWSDITPRDTIRAHVSYFDEDGRQAISQDAKIGVVGASSREIMMRPFKISVDQTIDPLNTKFKHRLFDKDITAYRHFQARNNNQDGIRYLPDPESRPTMGMRNALFSALFGKEEGIEIRYDGGPVLLFINGKNYGMMNMGEKRDNVGIRENNPEIKTKDVDLLVIRNDMGMRVERHNLGEGTVFIRPDGQVIYKGYFEDGAVEYEEISESTRRSGGTKAIDDFIAMDPTDANLLDPKTFIASMAAHVISCNTDFGMNNIAFWRSSPVGEKPGPFHTLSFDFDSMFGLYAEQRDLDTLLVYTENTKLFPDFMQKEEYRQAFIRKVDEYLNGPFTPENAHPVIDALERKMEPWIDHHLDMWADGQMDKKKWRKSVSELKRFFEDRPRFVRMYMRDYFGFPGYSDMTFQVTPEGAGAISMDTGVFTTPLEGTGTHAQIPMTIRTTAARGYRFSHFILNGAQVQEEVHTFTPDKDMTVQAVFVGDCNAPVADIVINEVVRSGRQKLKDENGEKQDWIEIHNTTDRPMDLTGMHLTDNERKLTKWQFPALSLDPGGFVVVFASGKNRTDPSGNLHASFKLSKEPVLLVDRDGTTVIDHMTLQETKDIRNDCAGIRYPDGSSVIMSSTTATPGQPNAYDGQS